MLQLHQYSRLPNHKTVDETKLQFSSTFTSTMSQAEYLAKAKDLIANNKYLMLSKSWCPDCHYTYRVWDQFGVRDKIHIIELDKIDPQEALKLERAFTEIAGRKWVPTIFFNGEILGTEQDLKTWAQQGKLEEIFKQHELI